MNQQLSWRTIVGYSLGDVANNFAFAMGALFLLSYYTDVAGVGAAAAGTMLLLVRVFDAFADVFAGRVVDSVNTRWGKFRPFLLFGTAPLMIFSVLVFWVPTDWSHGSKVLMNPLMILVKIIKLRWIHILSYDQMVSRKINNQTTRCANSIFYTTLFTNSAPNYT
ncbi:MFS transporter [Escherichia coli]|uniref:MFS transporter n=1 Tax=Escherichia coli TaxID=562 RepID=UPI0025A93102|nr:MFS transporter [Escherichia coli]